MRAAWEARAPLREHLLAEDTNCYRLFHGATEGDPSLNIDAYGDLLIVQFQREVPERAELEELWPVAEELGFTGMGAWLRQGSASRVIFQAGDCTARWVREFDLQYRVEALPRKLDPLLFLDSRTIRRYLRHNPRENALNLFAYTGSLGIATSANMDAEVWHVDFSQRALDLARGNAEQNGLPNHRFICEEIYPILWQLAGRQVKRRKPVPGKSSQGERTYARVEKRTFDRIILDPPQRSKGHYGAVDIKNDYAGLFRPCLQILAEGGELIATNNLAEVDIEDWTSQLERCARKYDRPWKSYQVLKPDDDFPSPDGRTPLKVLAIQF